VPPVFYGSAGMTDNLFTQLYHLLSKKKEVPIRRVSFTAHSLRSFEPQSSQRTFLFLFAEMAKRNKLKP
jgi:hypothetical protein